MALQLAQLFNFGTSTPAVARTAIQGKDIIQVLNRTPEQDEQANVVLAELMKKLLRCVELHDQISKAVDEAHAKVRDGSLLAQQQPNALRPPSIPDLENKAESFAQAAKLSIAHATRLTQPFYGQDFGHKLNKMAAWAATKYGNDHALVRLAKHWEPWVQDVLAMRDAVDHPSNNPRGRLHIRNFFLEPVQDGLVLSDPQWWLEGEAMQPMAETMGALIEGVILLQEDLLAVIFQEFKPNFPLVLCEIPVDQRNPNCPVRLRVGVSDAVKLPDTAQCSEDRPTGARCRSHNPGVR